MKECLLGSIDEKLAARHFPEISAPVFRKQRPLNKYINKAKKIFRISNNDKKNGVTISSIVLLVQYYD